MPLRVALDSWQVLAKDFGKLRVEPNHFIFLLLGTQFES